MKIYGAARKNQLAIWSLILEKKKAASETVRANYMHTMRCRMKGERQRTWSGWLEVAARDFFGNGVAARRLNAVSTSTSLLLLYFNKVKTRGETVQRKLPQGDGKF